MPNIIQEKVTKIQSILEATMLKLSVILISNHSDNLFDLGEKLVIEHCDEIANGGFWVWNHNTNEVYYSPKFCNTLGYKYGELGRGFGGFNRGNVEQMQKGMAMIDKLIAENSKDTFINNINFTKKDGSIITIECSGAILFIGEVPFVILGTHKLK